MLLQIWKNQMLSVDDKLEAAIGEIERLNELLESARVLFSTRVEASRLDAAMDEIEKLRSALRYQIMVYQVDDQSWDKDAEADRIMDRVLNDA